MRQPHFSIRYVGGPLHGRTRNVDRPPHELATAVAMPVNRGPRDDFQPREQLAVYQLRNENGDWSYSHLHTASAEDLGVELKNSEPTRVECLTAVS